MQHVFTFLCVILMVCCIVIAEPTKQDVKKEMELCSYSIRKMHEITVERWQKKLKFSGVGYGEIEEDSEIGMTFLVESRKASEDEIPYFLGRCKTEMIETSELPQPAPSTVPQSVKEPSLLLSSSSSHSTLGLLAYSTEEKGKLVALSVSHKQGDSFHLVDSKAPVSILNSKQNNGVDCASFSISSSEETTPRTRALEIPHLGHVIGSTVANVSEVVYKVGATSGLTRGRVKLVDYYHLKKDVLDLRKQLMIKNYEADNSLFCEAGDQGSLVVRKSGETSVEVIGMISHCFVAGPFKGYAVVTPWENVYWACKVTLTAPREEKKKDEL